MYESIVTNDNKTYSLKDNYAKELKSKISLSFERQ